MLQVEYKVKLGQDEFTIRAEVQDEKDFFQKMSFYSNLPKFGPNGENDLKITHRTTTQGYNYYSLVSESAKQEFKFGQVNEKDGGLYPKGWEPLFQKEEQQASQNTGFATSAPQAQRTVAANPALAAPYNQQQAPAPTTQVAAPYNAGFPGMVNPTTGPTAGGTAHTQVYAPVAAPTQVAPTPGVVTPSQTGVAPQVNPQVQAAANNVLQRFGIGKQ